MAPGPPVGDNEEVKARLAVSSAVSGIAEQKGDSSVRVRGKSNRGFFSETVGRHRDELLGFGAGCRPGSNSFPITGNLRPLWSL